MVVLSEGSGDAAATRVGLDLAASLSAGVRLIGYVDDPTGRSSTAASEALAHRADELRRETGVWVVPVFADGDGRALAARELAAAPVAVVPVGHDWAPRRDFGRPAEAIVEEAGCPLLVVRPAPAARVTAGPTRTTPAHA